MPRKQNSKPTKTPLDAGNATYAAIVKALTDLQDKFEIPQAAREFVKRSATTAKGNAADIHAGANKVTGALESGVINAVTGVADANRKLFEAAHEDAQAALVAIEKLAGAKSFAEAYQLYVDYVRERGEVGLARAKGVAEFVSEKVAEGIKTAQDGIAKVTPFAKAA